MDNVIRGINKLVPSLNWSSLSPKSKLAITLLALSTLAALISGFSTFGFIGLSAYVPLGFPSIYGISILIGLTVAFILTTCIGSVIFHLKHRQSNGDNKITDGNDQPPETLKRQRPNLEKYLYQFATPFGAFKVAKNKLHDGEACIYKIKQNGFILIWKDQGKWGFISRTMCSASSHKDQLDFNDYIDKKDLEAFKKTENAKRVYEIFERSPALESFSCIDTTDNRQSKQTYSTPHSPKPIKDEKRQIDEKKHQRLGIETYDITKNSAEEIEKDFKLKEGQARVFYSINSESYSVILKTSEGRIRVFDCGSKLPISKTSRGFDILTSKSEKFKLINPFAEDILVTQKKRVSDSNSEKNEDDEADLKMSDDETDSIASKTQNLAPKLPDIPNNVDSYENTTEANRALHEKLQDGEGCIYFSRKDNKFYIYIRESEEDVIFHKLGPALPVHKTLRSKKAMETKISTFDIDNLKKNIKKLKRKEDIKHSINYFKIINREGNIVALKIANELSEKEMSKNSLLLALCKGEAVLIQVNGGWYYALNSDDIRIIYHPLENDIQQNKARLLHTGGDYILREGILAPPNNLQKLFELQSA